MTGRRNVDELCKITGYSKEHVESILDKGVEIGAFKKISESDYEMTAMGLKVASKITNENYKTIDPGTWICSECRTVNNALNGKNCIKCNYSYLDSLASDAIKSEPKEYKFPLVTDREMLIFLVGHLTGMCASILPPKNISFKEKLQYNAQTTTVLSLLTSKVLEKFPHVTIEEFREIMHQLNAVRTMPFLDDALKELRRKR